MKTRNNTLQLIISKILAFLAEIRIDRDEYDDKAG